MFVAFIDFLDQEQILILLV